ncbi:unnamed protein product [Closterium sp. NIES-54]
MGHLLLSSFSLLHVHSFPTLFPLLPHSPHPHRTHPPTPLSTSRTFPTAPHLAAPQFVPRLLALLPLVSDDEGARTAVWSLLHALCSHALARGGRVLVVRRAGEPRDGLVGEEEEERGLGDCPEGGRQERMQEDGGEGEGEMGGAEGQQQQQQQQQQEVRSAGVAENSDQMEGGATTAAHPEASRSTASVSASASPRSSSAAAATAAVVVSTVVSEYERIVDDLEEHERHEHSVHVGDGSGSARSESGGEEEKDGHVGGREGRAGDADVDMGEAGMGRGEWRDGGANGACGGGAVAAHTQGHKATVCVRVLPLSSLHLSLSLFLSLPLPSLLPASSLSSNLPFISPNRTSLASSIQCRIACLAPASPSCPCLPFCLSLPSRSSHSLYLAFSLPPSLPPFLVLLLVVCVHTWQPAGTSKRGFTSSSVSSGSRSSSNSNSSSGSGCSRVARPMALTQATPMAALPSLALLRRFAAPIPTLHTASPSATSFLPLKSQCARSSGISTAACCSSNSSTSSSGNNNSSSSSRSSGSGSGNNSMRGSSPPRSRGYGSLPSDIDSAAPAAAAPAALTAAAAAAAAGHGRHAGEGSTAERSRRKKERAQGKTGAASHAGHGARSGSKSARGSSKGGGDGGGGSSGVGRVGGGAASSSKSGRGKRSKGKGKEGGTILSVLATFPLLSCVASCSFLPSPIAHPPTSSNPLPPSHVPFSSPLSFFLPPLLVPLFPFFSPLPRSRFSFPPSPPPPPLFPLSSLPSPLLPFSSLFPPAPLPLPFSFPLSSSPAYLVGGSIRDLLLDVPPKDYDVLSTATTHQVRAAASPRTVTALHLSRCLVSQLSSHLLLDVPPKDYDVLSPPPPPIRCAMHATSLLSSPLLSP